MWQVLLTVSLVIFWAGLIFLLNFWPRVSNMSISQHAAAHTKSYLLFTPIQFVVGFICYLFIINWFIPHFYLSLLFTTVYSVTSGLQLISALIPDTRNGIYSKIHEVLADTMALGILLSTLLLCFTHRINGFPRLLFGIAVIYMSLCLSLILSKKAKIDALRNYLLLQVGYIVIFQVSILVATLAA